MSYDTGMPHQCVYTIIEIESKASPHAWADPLGPVDNAYIIFCERQFIKGLQLAIFRNFPKREHMKVIRGSVGFGMVDIAQLLLVLAHWPPSSRFYYVDDNPMLCTIG